MLLQIALPENLFDHVADLKSQGFLLLCYLKENFEIGQQNKNKIKINLKTISQNLKIHISTLRRWLKKLIKLKFVKPLSSQIAKNRTPDSIRGSVANSQGPSKQPPKHVSVDPALLASPATRDLSAIRDDTNTEPSSDPLENFLDTLSKMEATGLRMRMRQEGVELNTDDREKLKAIMLTDMNYLQVVNEFYTMRLEMQAVSKAKEAQKDAEIKADKEWREKYGNARRAFQIGV